MYCHHFRSWMIWDGMAINPFFGEPLNLSSRWAKNTWPALMISEMNYSFPIKDSSCLWDIFAQLHQASSSACISSTLSGDIEIVMLIVLNKMPKTTMTEEGGHALCSHSQTMMSYKSQSNFQKSFSAFSRGELLWNHQGSWYKGLPRNYKYVLMQKWPTGKYMHWKCIPSPKLCQSRMPLTNKSLGMEHHRDLSRFDDMLCWDLFCTLGPLGPLPSPWCWRNQ